MPPGAEEVVFRNHFPVSDVSEHRPLLDWPKAAYTRLQ